MHGTKQATLVALYGPKTGSIAAFLTEANKEVEKELKSFEPYEPEQIHGTIVGLEHAMDKPGTNNNFFKYRAEEREMNVAEFLRCLRSSSYFPFEVQLGGFGDGECPFTSRGQPPFARSFSVQKDQKTQNYLVVFMGWPVNRNALADASSGHINSGAPLPYPSTLDDVRRWAQNFNILHQWHRTSGEIDNDFYFRIGLLGDNTSPAEIMRVEGALRNWLANRPPSYVTLTLSDLRVAIYEDDKLPPTTTESHAISELEPDRVKSILSVSGCL